MVEPKLSFLIPARNEEKNLARVIASIRQVIPVDLRFEIIVGDNLSVDGTRALAERLGAACLTFAGSPGGIRNGLARAADGNILVFLDADCELTESWGANIKAALPLLQGSQAAIIGSWVDIPDAATWIDRNWFGPMREIKHSHVNAAHIIIRRSVFLHLDGFDESAVTGEDVDLSRRAVRFGFVLRDLPKLRVVHHGYPKTSVDFYRRELWHGRGDVRSLASFSSSRVAVASSLLIAAFVGGLISAALFQSFLLVLISLAGFVVACVGSAVIRFGWHGGKRVIPQTFLFGLYYSARALAVLVPDRHWR